MRVSAPVDAVTIRSDPGDGHAARPGQLAAAVLLPDDPDDPEEPDDPDDPDEPLAREELDEDSFVVVGVDDDESEDDFSAGFAPSEPLVVPDPLPEPVPEARESFR
jgi:hypothetical protein